MAWIKTIAPANADARLRAALEGQAKLYPPEYAIPTDSETAEQKKFEGAGIDNSHSLIADAHYRACSSLGVLMSAELPLSRRQHEMIAAQVSGLNSCHY